jgi:Na+/H+ antiporter NhaD/arsenite permease-like protein
VPVHFVHSVRTIMKRDLVLTGACVLAILSSLVVRPRLASINFEVLGLLLALMLVVSGFRQLRVLEYVGRQLLSLCPTWPKVTLALLALPFFSSMVITNDVALLVFVPLALTCGRQCHRDVTRTVIWQTLAANLGSTLTPMGNPQNLFIYSHYQLALGTFLQSTILVTVLAAVWLVFLAWSITGRDLQLQLPEVALGSRGQLAFYSLLLLLCLAGVFRILDVRYAVAVTVAAVALGNRRLFGQVDYSLLCTFVAFFVFIGNMAALPLVQQTSSALLYSSGAVYLTGLVLSQFVSNVPATMLLAGFTQDAKALLLGVDVGGLGTLVASMASVISYKLFVQEHPHQTGIYLRMFLFYNFSGLLVLGTIVYVALLR